MKSKHPFAKLFHKMRTTGEELVRTHRLEDQGPDLVVALLMDFCSQLVPPGAGPESLVEEIAAISHMVGKDPLKLAACVSYIVEVIVSGQSQIQTQDN